MLRNAGGIYQNLKNRFELERIKCSNIVLFGAGRKGVEVLQEMRANDYNVVAFSDNHFEELSEVSGLPVIAPQKITEIPDVFVVIAVTVPLYRTIRHQLEQLKCPHLTYMELLLLLHEKLYGEVYTDFFRDETSKRVFEGILLAHLHGDEAYFRAVYEQRQYFAIPEFDLRCVNEIYVDCGAYVGDSIEQFIMNQGGAFKTIYAFEPADRSYHAMKKRVRRLNAEWDFSDNRIRCFNYAVGEKAMDIAVHVGTESTACNRVVARGDDSDKSTVRVISLDEFFADQEDMPTLIKADIEGDELHMLRGAKKLIAAHKPKMAICVYHNDKDLYELPMEIRKLNPEYQFALRHHTPQYAESVLYCW